jgi:hypothetical protein
MSVEENRRIVVLCERLAYATRARTAEWSREEEDTFMWASKEGSVSIGSRDKDGEAPYELVVVNAKGEKLDELTSQLLDDDRVADWNEPLAELYRAARRSALRADDVIEALMDALPPAASNPDAGDVGAKDAAVAAAPQ